MNGSQCAKNQGPVKVTPLVKGAACLVFMAAWVLPFPALAEVQLASPFSDHMVLQREMAVPVWGTAAPGEKVTVAFAGQTVSATAGADGKWMVKLDSLKASAEGRNLVASAGNSVTVSDVLVGEVWLGSGQSNMVVGSTGTAKNDPVLAEMVAKDHPLVRIGWGNKKDWRAAKAPVGLPALPFAFATNLQAHLQVPVGVLLGAVPGSSTDFWVTPQAVQADEECRRAIQTYAETVYPRERKAYEERLKKWEATDAAKRPANKPEPPLEPGAARHEVGKFFEQYIRPAIPFAVRGVLWDQGENGPSITGTRPMMVMRALITSWRKEWGRADLPWVYIQKPSGGGCAFDPQNPINRLAVEFAPLPEKVAASCFVREQYLKLLEIPNTYMVITSDLSPGVHPPNKSGYGARAAEVAMVAAYGKKAEIYGPLYAGSAVEGDKMRIRFTHTGKGLTFRHGEKLQGFVIAGEDKRFVWAEAVIDGETVVVSSPKVAKPAAVRYAYEDARFPWANLFNKDGLPAQAFRTDN